MNTSRPSNALNGFTPDEVYYKQKPKIDFAGLRKQDAVLRKESNTNNSCNKCDLVKELM